MITVPVKTTTENYSADEFSEGVSQECQNTILESGLTLDNTGTDLTQQKEAILRYSSAGPQYLDAGAGGNLYNLNSFNLSFNTPNFNYFDGMTVNFIAVVTNTGASQVNVNNMGPKDIVNTANDPIEINTILTSMYVTLRYDASNDRFVKLSPFPLDTIKAHARGFYNGTQSAGQNPILQRQGNIASIVSAAAGAFVWVVNFTIPIDTPLITLTAWNTNTLDNSGSEITNVTNSGFEIIYRVGVASQLNGFMFKVI